MLMFKGGENSKKYFETVFEKQRPNLLKINFNYVKLFPNSFILFTQKRWEKLIKINFCKYSLIQNKLT